MKTFTFYKENNLNQKYQLDIKEVRLRYLKYLKNHKASWIKNMYNEQSVTMFIIDKKGLNSTTSLENHMILQGDLKNTREIFLKLGIKTKLRT